MNESTVTEADTLLAIKLHGAPLTGHGVLTVERWAKACAAHRELGQREQIQLLDRKADLALRRCRWAIAKQLARWRDGDTVSCVAELQTAHEAALEIVGERKQDEPSVNPQ